MARKRKHCCEMMRSNVDKQCDQHAERHDCPDCLVSYIPKFREYGLIVHDGGSSMIVIQFCPWCGTQLPASLRHQWFAELRNLGVEPQDAPQEYRTDAWYAGRSRP